MVGNEERAARKQQRKQNHKCAADARSNAARLRKNILHPERDGDQRDNPKDEAQPGENTLSRRVQKENDVTQVSGQPDDQPQPQRRIEARLVLARHARSLAAVSGVRQREPPTQNEDGLFHSCFAQDCAPVRAQADL